jgi:hypothetical protein
VGLVLADEEGARDLAQRERAGRVPNQQKVGGPGLVRGGGNIGQDRINAVDGQPGTSGTLSTAFQQVKQGRQLVKEEALLKNRGSRYSPHDLQNPEFLDILRRCSQKRKAEKEEKDRRLKEEAARLDGQIPGENQRLAIGPRTGLGEFQGEDARKKAKEANRARYQEEELQRQQSLAENVISLSDDEEAKVDPRDGSLQFPPSQTKVKGEGL